MEIISRCAKDTLNFGLELGKTLKGGEIIELCGDMGCGKTVLTKGIAMGLNITADIVSPTFSILNIYEGKPSLCHYDCYRLLGEDEALDSGIDEYFGQSNCVCVIEWAENIGRLLRAYKTTRISLKYLNESSRKIAIDKEG